MIGRNDCGLIYKQQAAHIAKYEYSGNRSNALKDYKIFTCTSFSTDLETNFNFNAF